MDFFLLGELITLDNVVLFAFSSLVTLPVWALEGGMPISDLCFASYWVVWTWVSSFTSPSLTRIEPGSGTQVQTLGHQLLVMPQGYGWVLYGEEVGLPFSPAGQRLKGPGRFPWGVLEVMVAQVQACPAPA